MNGALHAMLSWLLVVPSAFLESNPIAETIRRRPRDTVLWPHPPGAVSHSVDDKRMEEYSCLRKKPSDFGKLSGKMQSDTKFVGGENAGQISLFVLNALQQKRFTLSKNTAFCLSEVAYTPENGVVFHSAVNVVCSQLESDYLCHLELQGLSLVVKRVGYQMA
eukprot:bmy_05137T0